MRERLDPWYGLSGLPQTCTLAGPRWTGDSDPDKPVPRLTVSVQCHCKRDERFGQFPSLDEILNRTTTANNVSWSYIAPGHLAALGKLNLPGAAPVRIEFGETARKPVRFSATDGERWSLSGLIMPVRVGECG